MTGTAKDLSPQIKAAKEKWLSHPIKDNDNRKKRLLNRPSGFFDRRPLRVLALALLLTIIAAPSLLPNFSACATSAEILLAADTVTGLVSPRLVGFDQRHFDLNQSVHLMNTLKFL